MKNSKLLPILIISVVVNAVFAAMFLAPQIAKFKASKLTTITQRTTSQATTISKDNLFDEINPVAGFEIEVPYGSLGPKMVAMGVIDADKFKSTYEKSSQPLTPEQEDILQKGSNEKIRITRDNSYFLLNFFWAVGLANKSSILETGPMMSYGGLKGAGGFASTGGWTLAKSDAMNYYSKANLIPLTKDQQALVALATDNMYRPCCDNSTAFPDCN